MIQKLKIWPEYYDDVVRGIKTFEVRIEDDRVYCQNDTLILEKYCPEQKKYLGPACEVFVPYVMKGSHFVGPGIVIMSIVFIKELS